MADYLVFQVAAPIVSWGEVALGEVRSTAIHPTRSAVFGLLAAALGIRRHERQRLAALDQSYFLAVRVDIPGTLLRDYHTVQVPSGGHDGTYSSRRAEVNVASLNTIISTRDYVVDQATTICVWARTSTPPYSLPELRDALGKPVFSPYLGRRSCPPGLPFAAQVVAVEGDFVAALGHFDESKARIAAGSMPPFVAGQRAVPNSRRALLWDAEAECVSVQPTQHVIRRDVPANRHTWQFTNRLEAQSTLDGSSLTKED